MGLCSSCCHKFACCYCPKSKTRCCHCRPTPKEPENDEINLDEVINNKEYNQWLEHTQIQEGRKWFYWVTLYVDLYCWIMIIGYAAGVFVAHLIPIMHWINPEKYEAWTTCRSLYTGKLQIPCIIVFHMIDPWAVISMWCICGYILRHWSYDKLDLFEKLIGLSNIITIAFFVFECVATWITFVTDAPPYQSYPIFVLLWTILIGIILGWYIQYHVYFYIRAARNYKVQYPETEAQIVSLVRESYVDRGRIRVVGSKHSAPFSIYVDNLFAENEIMISLDKYTGVRIFEVDEKEAEETGVIARAVAKGGTCLGLNRENPLSTKENGLVYILQREGYSLEDLGGVVMQTVGGFTAMGCAGGTIYHDYYESIYSIRIIDGTGQIRTYYKPTYEQDKEYNHDYWGVIVSMGLMGVISEVSYNLKKSYNVLGSQLLWPDHQKGKKFPISWMEKESVPPEQDGDGTGPLDIYGDNSDPKSLYNMFTNPDNRYKSEYSRLFVWPQVDPTLVTVWKGHQQQPQDSNFVEWKKNFAPDGSFRNVYYHEVGNPDTGKGGVAEQHLLSFFYNFFDHFTNINTMQLPDWAVKVIKFFIVTFNPTSEKPKNRMYFGAPWSDILPMDQEMWTQLMPMQFTELWFDIEKTDKVMQCLKEYWAENAGLQHTGTFSWEFYPAKPGGYSDKEKGQKSGGAWIRPSYGRTSFRVDALWFDVKTQIPYEFFTPLWNKFIEKGLKFRPHWAKWFPGGNVEFPHFPKEPEEFKEFKTWSDYYKAQYPKWNQWMELRKKLDPAGVFLNDYWKDTLNIRENNHKDPFDEPKGDKHLVRDKTEEAIELANESVEEEEVAVEVVETQDDPDPDREDSK